MTTPPSGDRPLHGILAANLAILVFTLMDGLVKIASDTYPVGQIVFFRSLCAFIPVLWLVSQSGGLSSLRTRKPIAHLVRGIIGVTAMAAFFLSYKLLPLPDAIAIGLSAPIFITLLSVPLLGEKVGLRRGIAILIGFIGVLIITRPGSGSFQLGAFVALSAAILYAFAIIAIRKLGRSEPAGRIVFYFTAFSTLVSLMSIFWGWIAPDIGGLVLLVAIGILGGIGQIAFTTAIRCAPVSIIAPFDYMALIYGIILGKSIWNDEPSFYLLLGAALVISSGLYILWRETIKKNKGSALPTIATLTSGHTDRARKE